MTKSTITWFLAIYDNHKPSCHQETDEHRPLLKWWVALKNCSTWIPVFSNYKLRVKLIFHLETLKQGTVEISMCKENPTHLQPHKTKFWQSIKYVYIDVYIYIYITYCCTTDCYQQSFTLSTLLKYKICTKPKFTGTSPGKAHTQTCVLQGEWETVVLNLLLQPADHGFEAASEFGRFETDAQLQTLKQKQWILHLFRHTRFTQ